MTVSCDDSDTCTADNCDALNGCSHATVVCNDSIACTTEICDSALGCVFTPISIEVTIAHVPPVDTIEKGQSITLVGSSNSSSLSYSWTSSQSVQSLSCDTCPSTEASPIITTSYTLIAIDINGCPDSLGTLIVVQGDTVSPNECLTSLYIPNAFTPNGDGVNDIFYVYGNGIEELHLRIFNRWGELIFESFNLAEGWDGTYRGHLLDPDVFVYELRIIFCDDNGLTPQQPLRTGSITLIR